MALLFPLFAFILFATFLRRYGILLMLTLFGCNSAITAFGLLCGAIPASSYHTADYSAVAPSCFFSSSRDLSCLIPSKPHQPVQSPYGQSTISQPVLSSDYVHTASPITSLFAQGSPRRHLPLFVTFPSRYGRRKCRLTARSTTRVQDAETLIATPASTGGLTVDAIQRSLVPSAIKRKTVKHDASSPPLIYDPLYKKPLCNTQKIGCRQSRTTFVSESVLPTNSGSLLVRAYHYCNAEKSFDILALMRKGPRITHNVMVRLHDQCITSEVFGSMRCDCKEQLDRSLQYAFKNKSILIYMQQEGRGIGLANKIAAYSLQDSGFDTVDANRELGFDDDTRSYEAIPFILENLGVESIRLITNNPFKMKAISLLGVRINERIPIVVKTNQWNKQYLRSKKEKMDHVMDFQSECDSLASRKEEDPSAMISIPSFDTTLSTDLHEGDTPSVDFLTRLSKENRWQMGEASVEQALEAFMNGGIVMITDDAGRENEGDLLLAAKFATPEKIAFMIEHSSGVLCTPMEEQRLQYLKIPNMTTNNEDFRKTAFTVSVDAADGSTGISAASRAKTIRLLGDLACKSEDLQRPGHIFPLISQKEGVYARQGHTEAAIDFCKLTNIFPAVAVIGEKVSTRFPAEMAKLPEIEEWCASHGVPLTTIEDLLCYRLSRESNFACKGAK
ncbi:putative Riboflavin biosynthesis protein RibBA [Cardiosporidium cionae]|uniref:GTP cyclohydrolase II n=1 Tax=Cardiosporidium cionae TaxID=476202 RepID=A0ABQ7J4D7_9APIC|nr:putative Riboflavin biosynthesis protein RibBA [Cardiosporidium cionae]|eukprot:KAF8817950.1 putative Riboflavin biosynthesis protein RibBA [Cardiosporidium cionae]